MRNRSASRRVRKFGHGGFCREIRLRGGQARPPVERVSRASKAKGGSVSAVGDPAGTNGDQRPKGGPATSILGAPDASKGVHPQPEPERLPARGREDAQALAEGELPCSRQVPRGWTSRGPPSVSDRRWCRLGRQRRLLNRLWLLTLGSRARPVAEPVHREAGSPCKIRRDRIYAPYGALADTVAERAVAIGYWPTVRQTHSSQPIQIP